MIKLLGLADLNASNAPIHPVQTELTCDPARVDVECNELEGAWRALRADPRASHVDCGNWTAKRCKSCGCYHLIRHLGAAQPLTLDAGFDRDPDEQEPWVRFRKWLVGLHCAGVLDLSWVQ